jgi:UDP-glucuronate 4-epimerase
MTAAPAAPVPPLEGRRILVTGPTGQVAKPLALSLARANEVVGIARFGNLAAREELEAGGVRCVSVDLAEGDLTDVPADVDVVLNLAVAKTADVDHDLRANVEATGLLMSHCRGASAFLHCSSTAVYQPVAGRRYTEDDPLGENNHRLMFPTYTLCKVAAEAMARFGAREYGIPTVIARLNVPYGDNGGWPWLHMEQVIAGQPIALHPDGSQYNLIHEDDILATVPALLAAASVPATIVNWGGTEETSIEAWSRYIGELVGKEVSFVETDMTIEPVPVDVSKLRSIAGESRVSMRDGIRRMVAHFHPELVGGA